MDVTEELTDIERASVRHAIRAATRPDAHCHTEVSRRGRHEPCGRPPVAIGHSIAAHHWPVCAHHARVGWCVPLRQVIAVALEDTP